ncbi:ABC transporter ATP-binding protein [bacterium]|nr:ABC transporter ATP-binding protein [bacterium]
MSTIIDIKGLTKVYVRDVIGTEHGRIRLRLKDRKRVALENLNLQVEEGQIFGLLGPNGAGKTTTIKILMGLHFPTAGSATIMGRPLGDVSSKAQIGFLPENPFFYDYLTGQEFLDFYGQLYGMDRAARRRRIPELLEQVGLEDSGNVPLRGYSKGMLQRVGLAQALLNDPKLVILDEPQSGLDPFGRKEVRDLILRLKEAGKTVMFSSHILGDAEMICDRVGILNQGKLIAEGQLSELLSTRVIAYEMEMASPSAELLADVRKSARRVLEQGESYLADFETEEEAKKTLSRLAGGEGTLVSYAPRRETLEGYFIREIEGKRAEAANAEGKGAKA